MLHLHTVGCHALSRILSLPMNLLVFLAFVLAVAAAFLLYGLRRPGFLGLRGLSLVLLLLMALNPRISWRQTRVLQPVVVVDASRSMGQDEKWQAVLQVLQQQVAGLRVRFLVDTSLQDRVNRPTGRFTNLSVPLQRIHAPLVLLSDGLHNAGPSPRNHPFPVSVWWPRQATATDVLQGLQVRVPARLLEHQPFTLVLHWPRPPRAGTLAVFLEDSLLQQWPVRPGEAWRRAVPLPGLAPGRYQLRIRWFPGHATRSLEIQVDPVPFRVLLRVYRPLPGVRPLRHTLETFGRVEVWLKTPKGWRLLSETPQTRPEPPPPEEYTVVVDVAPPKPESLSVPQVVLVGPEDPGNFPRASGPWWFPNRPELPPLEYLRTGPQGSVLLRVKGPRGELQPLAVVASGRLWVLSGQVWRWALAQPALWDSLWDRWLARLLAQRVLFRGQVVPRRAAPGTPLTVEALFTDLRGRRLPGAWVQVAGGPALVEIDPGRFQGEVPAADRPGVHTLRLLYGVATDTLGSQTLRYRTVSVDLETLEEGVDSLLLAALAQRTGGRVLPDTGRWNLPPYRQRLVRTVTFARTPWLFLALLLSLFLEWFLRQRRGWL